MFYFGKMKEISNGFILAGYDLSYVVQLLNGLASEYDAVVINIDSQKMFLE